jgi:hypothetical protein
MRRVALASRPPGKSGYFEQLLLVRRSNIDTAPAGELIRDAFDGLGATLAEPALA